MSDYQFVHFLASDAPLDEKQLVFMRKQAFSYQIDLAAGDPLGKSNRVLTRKQSQTAKITEWEFIDEYRGEFDGGNFFSGNHWEMLQQGYDSYLDYFNFGIRSLEFHLPGGPPCGQKLMTTFTLAGGVEWRGDHDRVSPPAEDEWTMPGVLELDTVRENNDAFRKAPIDPAPLLRQIAPVRKLLARGDVRPLYLSWLAGYYDPEDENALEPPVPAGLGSLAPPLQAMGVFYGLSPQLVAAAAARSPALPETGMPAMQWPMAEPARTMTQLRKAAGQGLAVRNEG